MKRRGRGIDVKAIVIGRVEFVGKTFKYERICEVLQERKEIVMYGREVLRKGWKLTLKDDGREGFAIRTTEKEDQKLTVDYSNAKTGDGEYLSAIIEDNNTKAYTHYGKLKQLKLSILVDTFSSRIFTMIRTLC